MPEAVSVGHWPPSPQTAEQEVMRGQRHAGNSDTLRPPQRRPHRWQRVRDRRGLRLEGSSDGLRVPAPSTEPGLVRV